MLRIKRFAHKPNNLQMIGLIMNNKDATEAAVEAQIQALINPPVVTQPLPWGQA